MIPGWEKYHVQCAPGPSPPERKPVPHIRGFTILINRKLIFLLNVEKRAPDFTSYSVAEHIVDVIADLIHTSRLIDKHQTIGCTKRHVRRNS